jgi:pimeloyl-ACP methyl ester carboxylesterase
VPRPSPRARSLVILATLAVSACGTSPIVAGNLGAPTPGQTSSSTSTSEGTSTSSGSSSSSTSSTESATSSGGAGTLAFSPCTDANAPSGAQCATFHVPLDYSDPSKGSIGEAIVKVPAINRAQRIGSLLVNPGGPGASGVQFVEQDMDLFATLNQRFDIVGFDPRGIGDPDPVACETTAQLDAIVAVDPIVDDDAEKQAVVDTSKQLAADCQAKSARLLPYVGTDNVARDLDALRAALGDAKITYFGFSYGTDIGSEYAQMFPTHIRAMVLDGDVDPSIGLVTQVENQSDWLEKNYQEFLRRCTAQTSCPMGTNPGANVSALLSQLDAHPVAASDGRMIGRGEALVSLLASMYEPSVWHQVYVLFGRAITTGNVDGLELLTDSYTGRHPNGFDHQMEAGTAVDCVDHSVPLDLATYDAEAQKTQARDPDFGDAAVYGVLPCAYWPVHGPDPKPRSVTGAPPIVLVGATMDPATPYAWSQSLQTQIAGSVLLTRDGFGHTSYQASSCIAGHVDAYLNDLTVPAAGITCPSN